MPAQRRRNLRTAPEARPVPVPLPGPRCGWPESGCKLPASAHNPEPGHRDIWTYHTTQCQVPNPDPGPGAGGYSVCCMAARHKGDHCYQRHIAEGSSNDHRNG